MKVTARWGVILTLVALVSAMEQPQWEWNQQFPTSPPFIEKQRWLKPHSPIAYSGSAWDMVARASRRQTENLVSGQDKLYSPPSRAETHQKPNDEDDDPLEASQSVGVPILSTLKENETVLVPDLTGNFTETSGELGKDSAVEEPGSDTEQRPDETRQNGQVAEQEETYVSAPEPIRNVTHTISEPSLETSIAKLGDDPEEKGNEPVQQQRNEQHSNKEIPESALNSTQTNHEERQDYAAGNIEEEEERGPNITEEALGQVNTTLALELLEDGDLSQEESMFSFSTDPIALRIVSPAPYLRRNESLQTESTSANNSTHLAKRQTALKREETSLLNRNSDNSTSRTAKSQVPLQRLQVTVNASQLIHDLAEATSRHYQVLSEQTGKDTTHSPLTKILLDQHRSKTLAHSSAGLSSSGTVLGHLHTKHNPWLQRYAPYFVTNPVPKLLSQQGSPEEHPDEIKQVYIEDTVLVPPSEYPEQVLRTIHDAKLRSLPMPQETVYVENGGNRVQPARFEENQVFLHFNEVKGQSGREIKLQPPHIIHHVQEPPEHFNQEFTSDLEVSSGPSQNTAENENLLKEIHDSHPGFGAPLTVNTGFHEEEANRPFPQQSSEGNFFSHPVHGSSQSQAAIPAQNPSIYVNEFQDIVVRPSEPDHETVQHNSIHIQQVDQFEADPEHKQTLQLPNLADLDGYSAPHPEDILRSMTPTQQKIIQETFKALLSPAMSGEYSSPKLQDILLLDVINQYAEDKNENPHSDSAGEYSSPKVQDIVPLSDSQTVDHSTSVFLLTTPAPWVAPGSSTADSGSFSPPKPEDVISLVDSQMYEAVMTSTTQPRPQGQYGTPKPADVVGSHREGKLLRLPAYQPEAALPDNARLGPLPGHSADTSPPATYGRPKQSDVILEDDAAALQLRLQGYPDLSAGAHDSHNSFESQRVFAIEDASSQTSVPTNSGVPDGYRPPKESDIVEVQAESVKFTPVSFPQRLVNNYKRQVLGSSAHLNDNVASSDPSLASPSPEVTRPSHLLQAPKPLPSSSRGTISTQGTANGVHGEDFLQQSALVAAKLDEFSEKELQREVLTTPKTPYHPELPSVSSSATPPPSMSPLLADSPWRPYRPQFALQARRERRLGAGDVEGGDPDRWVWPSSNRQGIPPADAVSPRVLFPRL